MNNASHEALQSKQMPFSLDGRPSSADSPPGTPLADLHTPPAFGVLPNSPSRPHRTQSTTALYPPVRVPPTVLETGTTSPVPESHPTVGGGSPRRARASTGVTRQRGSVERLPEEDASWWTEEIHKRREIRRRWREAEDENTVVIGNKIDTNHPNYVTAYNMLTGLRVAVFSLCYVANA